VDADPRALHIWLHLPEPLRSDECVARARPLEILRDILDGASDPVAQIL
jgi:hypothetical protein